jgi:hypothetical protein
MDMIMQDASESTDLPAPKSAAGSKLFDFKHPVFAIKGSYFRIGTDGETPLYYVLMGDAHAGIAIEHLARSFSLPKGGEDAMLIQMAVAGLKYVHEIRPGDSIPSELLDGSASWTVTRRHTEAAEARFSMQLISWLNGKPMSTLDGHAFADLLNEPSTKTKVQDAFTAIAVKLGLGAERRQEVVGKVDELIREWSFIEALRTRSFKVRKIAVMLKSLAAVYKNERSAREEIGRVQSLMTAPLQKLAGLFEHLDGNTEDLIAVLRKFDDTVAYVRQKRDELHQNLMRWDELINAWANAPLEKSKANERLIRQTYRFVARHFPQMREW